MKLKRKKEVQNLKGAEIDRYLDKVLGEAMEGNIPTFCPNCGNVVKNSINTMIDAHGVQLMEGQYVSIVFDCLCEYCDWSGFICPDALKEIAIWDEDDN